MIHVLVADDTKNIRALLTKCLEFEGYVVKTAVDGKTALEIIPKERFDLIFLDIRMPEISGTEVLRRIREMGINTPVVIITAFATVKNAVDCTQLGAVAYLQKPFTETKIKSVLEEVLHLKCDMSSLEDILSLAKQKIKIGHFEEAEHLLKNSMPTFPLEPDIYMLLSKVCVTLNKSEDAKKYLEMSKVLFKRY
jgi:two-component system OmpR family response regulator